MTPSDSAAATRPAVEVRPLAAGDLPIVARLHLDVLPPSFFSRLGTRYLRAYLDTYRRSPHATAVVAVRAGQVIGFLVGPTSPAAHAAWVLRRGGARLAGLALLGMLVRPRLLVFFLRTRVGRYTRGLARRFRPAPSAATATTDVARPPAVLAHVAVAPDAQGLGAGQALADRFASDARTAGSEAVELVTRAGSPAEAFYARLGYERLGERVDQDGARWARYRLELA